MHVLLLLALAAPLGLAGLDHQLDFRDLHRVPVAVGDLVLEIAQAVAVAAGLGLVLVFEGFSQPVPVMGVAGALGAVGHDDVSVTVRLFTGRPVRMLDDLHQPVGMGILAQVMPVDVLVIVTVRHTPMLPAGPCSDQAAAGQ